MLKISMLDKWVQWKEVNSYMKKANKKYNNNYKMLQMERHMNKNIVHINLVLIRNQYKWFIRKVHKDKLYLSYKKMLREE